MMERKPITAKGYRNLQDELQQLIKHERSKIINDIEEARAHGDLKENAEYHAAKEKQGFVEGRIQHLNFLLANSEIIDISNTNSDQVRFGATVTYEDVETEEQVTWRIVGEDEADIDNGEISIKSPIARALLGKEEGDDIKIKVPKGTIEVEITSIEYA
ncbi:MAG: transcription elongation factor GreA [Proteobacteria bacterium]|nr:transcription elongation factor GreA [Pseudomonadota bacterium]